MPLCVFLFMPSFFMFQTERMSRRQCDREKKSSRMRVRKARMKATCNDKFKYLFPLSLSQEFVYVCILRLYSLYFDAFRNYISIAFEATH